MSRVIKPDSRLSGTQPCRRRAKRRQTKWAWRRALEPGIAKDPNSDSSDGAWLGESEFAHGLARHAMVTEEKTGRGVLFLVA
jgi:hypothetical protein